MTSYFFQDPLLESFAKISMQSSSNQTTSTLLMKIANTVLMAKAQPAVTNFLSGQTDPVLHGIFNLLTEEKLGFDWKKIVLIGCSAGGDVALRSLFKTISVPHLPIVIVMHHRPGFSFLSRFEMKNSITQVAIDLKDHTPLLGSRIYFLKGDLGVRYMSSSKSIDLMPRKTKTLFRPDINEVFFEMAKRAGRELIGVILSGMLYDGAKGLREIADNQGEVWIQKPDMALFKDMPLAAIEAVPGANIGSLLEIGNRINQLSQTQMAYAAV